MFERSEWLDAPTRRTETGDANPRGEATADAVSRWCDYCDGPIATDEWHPVVTRRDDDGNVEIYAFCDESCRKRWERERDD